MASSIASRVTFGTCGTALCLNGCEVGQDALLRNGFRAVGEVNLVGAEISGNLDCSGAGFHNHKGSALVADGAVIHGDLLIREGFNSHGKIQLEGTHVVGDLDCRKSLLRSDISATRAHVDGNVRLQQTEMNSLVELQRARIGGDLTISKCSFIGSGLCGIDARACDVGGVFVWDSITKTPKTVLWLRNARVGVLDDRADSWPDRGKLEIQGLTYERIGEQSPAEAKARIDWIERQGPIFRPQPYSQLARILKESGREDDAREVLIAKEDAFSKYARLGCKTLLWRRVLSFDNSLWIPSYASPVGYRIFHLARQFSLPPRKLCSCYETDGA